MGSKIPPGKAIQQRDEQKQTKNIFNATANRSRYNETREKKNNVAFGATHVLISFLK